MSGGAAPVVCLPGSDMRETGVSPDQGESRKISHGDRMRLLKTSKTSPKSPREARVGLDLGTASPGRRDDGETGEDRARPRSPGVRRSWEVFGLAPRRAGLAGSSGSREGVEELASVGPSVPGGRAGPCLTFVDENPHDGIGQQAADLAGGDEQGSILDEDDSSAHTYVPSDGCDGHWWLRWSPAQRAAWSAWHHAGHTLSGREAYLAENGQRWCDDWNFFEGQYCGRDS